MKVPVPGLTPAGAARMLEKRGQAGFPVLAKEIPTVFDVDVIVTDLDGEGYSFVTQGRCVIVVKRTAHWFRQNFSVAHELAHLALGTTHGATSPMDEKGANAFAAEMLMPAATLRSFRWDDLGEIARWVREHGVSTQALRTRLDALGITVSNEVLDALSTKTVAFLHEHDHLSTLASDMAEATETASERRFPKELTERLTAAVMTGKAPVAPLAHITGLAPEEFHELLPIPEESDLSFWGDLLQ